MRARQWVTHVAGAPVFCHVLILTLFLLQDRTTSRPADVPEVLEFAIRAREPVQTAYLRYTLEEDEPGFASRTSHFIVRMSGSAMAITELPGPDGVRLRNPRSGEAMLGVRAACNPLHEIYNEAQGFMWRYPENYPDMTLGGVERIRPYVHPTSFGLYPGAMQKITPADFLRSTREAGYKWSVSREGSLHRVIGLHDAGGGNYWQDEWLIDASRGHAVLRVSSTEMLKDGIVRLLGEAKSDYEKVDGRWWPIRVECRHPLTQIHKLLVVERAELDRANHPKELTPDLFGVPLGMRVWRPSPDPTERSEKRRYVGEGRTLSEEEWLPVKAQFEPALLDWLRSNAFGRSAGEFPSWWYESEEACGLNGVARQPDQWEAYVRRWIMKHRPAHRHKPEFPLDEKQVNAAWAILKDCKGRAIPLREKLDRLEPARAVASSATSQAVASVPAGSAVKTAPPRSPEALRLEGQIEHTFGELKTRLNALLTSSQLKESQGPPPPKATSPLEMGPPKPRR